MSKPFDPKREPDSVAIPVVQKAYGLTENEARFALAIMRGEKSGDVINDSAKTTKGR